MSAPRVYIWRPWGGTAFITPRHDVGRCLRHLLLPPDLILRHPKLQLPLLWLLARAIYRGHIGEYR